MQAVCGTCCRAFQTSRGLAVHQGHTGHVSSFTDNTPLPPPPPAALPLPPDDAADADMPPVEPEWMGALDGAEEDPDVDAARRMARSMLVQDGWQDWAKAQLEYAERGALRDVSRLFPAAEDFDTEETFRYGPCAMAPVPRNSPPQVPRTEGHVPRGPVPRGAAEGQQEEAPGPGQGAPPVTDLCHGGYLAVDYDRNIFHSYSTGVLYSTHIPLILHSYSTHIPLIFHPYSSTGKKVEYSNWEVRPFVNGGSEYFPLIFHRR